MNQKLIVILFLFLFPNILNAQLIDRYGINLGASYSTQTWDEMNWSTWQKDKDYRIGIMAFVFAEKDFGKLFGIKSEIGYLQKGFKEILEFKHLDGPVTYSQGDGVLLHNLAMSLELKASPFHSKVAPYAIIGIRGEYLLSYDDSYYLEPGSGKRFPIYEYFLQDYNDFNVGALAGIGIEINDMVFIEFNYNTSLSHHYYNGTKIKDKCWGAKLGVYLNQFF